jgi:hypothetical protein
LQPCVDCPWNHSAMHLHSSGNREL